MNLVTKTFECYCVCFPNSYDGSYDEEYFKDEGEMIEFLDKLSSENRPYAIKCVYDCVYFRNVKSNAIGKSVVNKN